MSLDEYRALLAPAAAKRAPAICTNPDKIMLTAAGPRFGAGRIAELYEELGGTVTWIGKPFPEIYRAALAELGDPDPSRVIGVGDSIETRHRRGSRCRASLGACALGCSCRNGGSELEVLFRRHGATPDYLLDSFIGPPH
jgi:HAD superfamily hydrolase (TIGR01459 family)